jgi:peptidoglycan-N-acetylglucosamine deacetylase
MDLNSSQFLTFGLPAAASVVVAGVMAYGTFIPGSTLWGRNISRGPASEGNRIALTFDDGPTPGFSDHILEILDSHGVPASFFVIGRNAAAHPELLRRIDQAHHLIGNHSFDHDHLGVFRGPRYWLDQLRRTDETVLNTIGKRPALFRPPVGIKFYFAAQAARLCGHTMVTWSLSGRDGLETSPQRILGRVVPRCRGGDILTLHDGIDPHCARTPEVTVQTLPRLIEQLRGRGFSFVRVDELVGVKGYL